MPITNEKQLLKNSETPETLRARSILVEIVNAAIAAVNPFSAMQRHLRLEKGRLMVGNKALEISELDKVVVVGGGKAGGAMSEALERVIGDRISSGLVNVPQGTRSKYRTRKIGLAEAGHPLPTEGGARGAERMMNLVRGLGTRDLVICLLSGGGSSLIALPADGISLDELRETTQSLLKSGASIQEVNSVRKHLSKISGGQLAKAASPARVVTLVISDVVGDRLDTIASGPTYPDPTTYPDALAVIEKYGLAGKMPSSVLSRLELGKARKLPETPKPGEKCFLNTRHEIVARNADAVRASVAVGRAHGLNVRILTEKMQGEARQVGADFAASARKVAEAGKRTPALLVSGGETTVAVIGEGSGGRNQEIALSAATVISGLNNAAVVSFSTDGIDGPTTAAGAIADGFTVERARRLGLDSVAYLRRNDSHSFFEKLGDLVVTGITGTNVMDLTCFCVI